MVIDVKKNGKYIILISESNWGNQKSEIWISIDYITMLCVTPIEQGKEYQVSIKLIDVPSTLYTMKKEAYDIFVSSLQNN